MKKNSYTAHFVIPLLFLFLIPICTWGQSTSSRLSSTPPGTIKINDSIYIDKAPVTNTMYLEFLESITDFWDLTKSDSLKNLPQHNLSLTKFKPESNALLVQMSSVDSISIGKNMINIIDYFGYPGYAKNPFLNVSRQQAEIFCKWRTDMVMLLWAIKSKTPEERKKFPKNITYRLPTKAEFAMAKKHFASQDDLHYIAGDFPFDKKRLKKFQKKKGMIFLELKEHTLNEDFFYNYTIREQNSKRHQKYIGFRCICEVEE